MNFFGMMTGYLETQIKDEHSEMVQKAIKKIKKQN